MNDDSIEVHGAHVYDATGAISEPIYLSATYRHPGFRQSTGYDYGRCANPTRAVLEKTLAMLERGERAWGVASGMAAVNIVLMLLIVIGGLVLRHRGDSEPCHPGLQRRGLGQ